jgi:hypothetical protein
MSREIFTETEKEHNKLTLDIQKKLPSSEENLKLIHNLIDIFYKYGTEKYLEGYK